jgi:1L-myo-inositol 1-phosphate cytidylyltransferase / CDP-L-myo-inositol myo-inositolphosphotransferase
MLRECVILADAPGALVELCGISILERLLRTLQRCGITRAIVLSHTRQLIEEHLSQPSWAREQIQWTLHERANESLKVEEIVDLWPEAEQFLLVVRGDTVFDIRLLQLLCAQSSAATLIDSAVLPQLQALVAEMPSVGGGKLCGAALLSRDWALAQTGLFEKALCESVERRAIATIDVAGQPIYYPALRRKLRPFWFPSPDTAHRKLAECVLFKSVQKGTLDFPALIHAPIEDFLLSRLCKTSITPHQLTISWIVAAFGTTAFFATGHLVCGIALAFAVGIIDGLDGKQARIKVETTKGGSLEHRFDDFFDVAWPTALAWHFYSSGELSGAFRYLLVLLLAEALDGIGKAGIYLASRKSMKEPGTFDRIVRFIGGRRNIYVWVLTIGIILGAPAKAFIVMFWWELLTALVDLPHAAWALYRWREKSRAGTR